MHTALPIIFRTPIANILTVIFGGGQAYVFGGGPPPPPPPPHVDNPYNDIGEMIAGEELDHFLFEARIPQPPQLPAPYLHPAREPKRAIPRPALGDIRRARLERLDDKPEARLAAANGLAPPAGRPRVLALHAAAVRPQVVPNMLDGAERYAEALAMDEHLRQIRRRVERRQERGAPAMVAPPSPKRAAVIPRPDTPPPNPQVQMELHARLDQLKWEREHRRQQREQHLADAYAEQDRLNQQLMELRRRYGGHDG
jgi:hypothetical protein